MIDHIVPWVLTVVTLLVGALLADHFRIKQQLNDLRLEMSKDYASVKRADQTDEKLDKLSSKVNEVLVILAKIDGAINASKSTV